MEQRKSFANVYYLMLINSINNNFTKLKLCMNGVTNKSLWKSTLESPNTMFRSFAIKKHLKQSKKTGICAAVLWYTKINIISNLDTLHFKTTYIKPSKLSLWIHSKKDLLFIIRKLLNLSWLLLQRTLCDPKTTNRIGICVFPAVRVLVLQMIGNLFTLLSLK